MKLLKYQYNRFNSWRDALIAYNAGASYVVNNKELLKETEDFVSKNAEEVEAFRVRMLGARGELKKLFSEFKNVD